MKKMKRFQEDVAEFYSYLNFIENNLSLSSTEIIKEILKQHNLSRTKLDRKFKKLYSSNNGYPETLSTYIKRRQNKENILRGGRIFGFEERYDIKDLLEQVKNMNMVSNYRLYDIENLDKSNTCESNLNTICNEYHYKSLAEDEYIVVIKRLELCK
ncbi:hypothetical protein HF520_10640 [Romboutsia sp. CE17]|uniref:hypothetical protein n=1 Tax=Romboutsia sp. CE17 TaxID=2724150 RepID=UPI001442E01A|nr:hypothetical protein [Romboutsia sp. CE17]QJA09387.1 hypothetical protein HF520_10640 [Romboutsia sp. CE17]